MPSELFSETRNIYSKIHKYKQITKNGEEEREN